MDKPIAPQIAAWSFWLLFCGLLFPFVLLIVILILKLPSADWFLTAGWISAFIPSLLSFILNFSHRKTATNQSVWITNTVYLSILVVLLIVAVIILFFPAGSAGHANLMPSPSFAK